MVFLRPFTAACKMLLALTVLLGVIYPLIVTGVGMVMPERAGGSLIFVDARVAGSELLGQHVTDPRFFHARPSVSDYAGDTSGGSNLAQNSPALADAVSARVAELRAQNPHAVGPIPADALTASASGLDPHISAAYAEWQAPRVASATAVPIAEVQALIRAHTTQPALGFIGNPCVNVTELNAALSLRIDGGH